MKIENDKYYTSRDLAKYCINKTFKIIGRENISEIIEPSAGNGSFSNQIKDCIAYDIEPESEGILKQDYLSLNLDYKKGRLIIGNPPYGNRSNLVTSFYKKSLLLGDYISFILPIGQLNNNIKLYEFDLIYSEDLDLKFYTDRKLHCCFNIYKRPINNILNKKPSYKLKDVDIKEDIISKNPKRNKRVKKEDFNYDIRICYWGCATGKEVKYERQYTHEFSIKIYNEKYKDKILKILKNVVWDKIYPNVATPALYQWQVYKYLKEQIPELQ